MAGKGGARPGAGRPKKHFGVDGAVAVEVLARLGELGIPGVKTEADYILHLMKTRKDAAVPLFTEMLHYKLGKPAQAVIAQGTLTIEVVERTSANHSATEADATEKVM